MNPTPEIRDTAYPRTPLTFVSGKLHSPTANDVFELIRDIIDPEHPVTLEKLGVVTPAGIEVFEDTCEGTEVYCNGTVKVIRVSFKPTIHHCSMANLIGLSIKIQLLKYVSPEYLIQVSVLRDGHVQEKELNKQLNDKDRVNAAMESESVMTLVNEILPVMECN